MNKFSNSNRTMKTIRTEYQRLIDLASSPLGWKEIQRTWSVATDSMFIDGKLLSKGETDCPLIKGFAIDPVTKRCMISCATYHSRAYLDMVSWITKNEPNIDIDAALSRPIKGWIGAILDFEFPCILMGDSRLFSDRPLLELVEEAILSQNVGLPLNKLYI